MSDFFKNSRGDFLVAAAEVGDGHFGPGLGLGAVGELEEMGEGLNRGPVISELEPGVAEEEGGLAVLGRLVAGDGGELIDDGIEAGGGRPFRRSRS